MLNPRIIQDVVRRVVAVARNPRRVILFGSYARGEAREDSDLDLIVVEKEVADVGEEMVRLQDAIGWLGVDADVLVYSGAEYEQRRNWCSTPVYWAIREGRVLYEYLIHESHVDQPMHLVMCNGEWAMGKNRHLAPITHFFFPITRKSCY